MCRLFFAILWTYIKPSLALSTYAGLMRARVTPQICQFLLLFLQDSFLFCQLFSQSGSLVFHPICVYTLTNCFSSLFSAYAFSEFRCFLDRNVEFITVDEGARTDLRQVNIVLVKVDMVHARYVYSLCFSNYFRGTTFLFGRLLH